MEKIRSNNGIAQVRFLASYDGIEEASNGFRACVDCLKPLADSLLGESPGRDTLVCPKVHPEMRGFTTERGLKDFIVYLGGVLTRETASGHLNTAGFGPTGANGNGFFYDTASGRAHIELFLSNDGERWVVSGFAMFRNPTGPLRNLKRLGFTTGLVGQSKVSNILAI